MNTQLLCTFTNIKQYSDEVDQLCNFYKIVFGKVFCLQNVDSLDEIYLTYNVNSDNMFKNGFYKNTISMHRKKDTDTLYTINSMNSLIKKLNNNILDKSFRINWSNYANSIMLTNDNSDIKLITTKLFKIIKI